MPSQKRITLDGDHFYIDLVFYNRLLRCFVLIDLKLGKLVHQDLGQMQMYVNYFDRYQREEHEAATVGVVLCSDKNDAMVKITLPEDNAQIHASRYQLYLPTEDELRAELERQRDEAERVLRLAASSKGDGTITRPATQRIQRGSMGPFCKSNPGAGIGGAGLGASGCGPRITLVGDIDIGDIGGYG